MELRHLGDALGDLVLGARCAGCGATALGLCPGCRRSLERLQPVLVARALTGFPQTVATGEYGGSLRQVVLATKERGALGHLPLLGALLARAVAALVLAAPQPVTRLVLVPVPSVRSRVIERGLDLTADLGRRAASRLRGSGLPTQVARAVRLRHDPADQAGLGLRDRVANSRGAYTWSRQAPAGSVVLIDDVVTTGATLSSIGCAAHASGIELLGAATVAQTPRRGDSQGSPRVG